MRIVELVLVVAAAAACAPGQPDGLMKDPGEPAIDVFGVLVSVENDRPQGMQIFATRAGMRFLVGEVGPRKRAQFQLPPMILMGKGELRLVADPFGSTLMEESQPIVLSGGREVTWRLTAGGNARLHVR